MFKKFKDWISKPYEPTYVILCCPCCGGNAQLWVGELGLGLIECEDCHIGTGYGEPAKVVEMWTKRYA